MRNAAEERTGENFDGIPLSLLFFPAVELEHNTPGRKRGKVEEFSPWKEEKKGKVSQKGSRSVRAKEIKGSGKLYQHTMDLV